MKLKILLSLFILFFSNVGFSTSKIYVKYGNQYVSSYFTINVFSQGELIEADSYSRGSAATFDDLKDDITYTYYLADTNHSGSLANGQTKTLECTKINIRLVDTGGNPISNERVEIYENGDLITSESTDSDGYAIFYLKQSDKYAYLCDYGEGKVGTTTINQQTDIVVNGNILEIVPKYGDIPVPGIYYLYSSDGSKSQSLPKNYNGVLRFPVTNNNKYTIKNKYGVYSKEIIANNSNNRYYLEHYKVTFISNSNDPNVLKNLKVGGQSGETKITDGKGYVVYYLLPGEYTYSHLLGSGTVVVSDTDQVINLSSTDVKITFNSTTGFYGKQFSVTDESGLSSKYTTDSNGSTTISICGSKFYVNINGIGSYVCATTNQYIQIPVYTLRINSNKQSEQLYIKDENNNYFYTKSNTNIDLIGGKYSYSLNSGGYVDLVLDKDMEIEANSYNLLLTVIDKNNLPVSSTYYLYKDGTFIESISTNSQGKVTVELPQGQYEISRTNPMDIVGRFTISNEDVKLQIEEESLMQLKAIKNGIMYNGNILISKDMTSVNSVSFIDGVASLRLEEGEYFVYTSGPNLGYKKISLYDNVVIELAELNLSSEGKGLAFPCTFYDDISHNVIKGQTIRFAAVPMEGYKCDYWEINGQIYQTDMIEYQITDDKTTAVAHFSSSISSIQDASSSSNTLNIQVADNLLIFPNHIEGMVTIYNSAGIMVKEIYMVSDNLNVSDLPAGVYILSLTDKNKQIFVTKFIL